MPYSTKNIYLNKAFNKNRRTSLAGLFYALTDKPSLTIKGQMCEGLQLTQNGSFFFSKKSCTIGRDFYKKNYFWSSKKFPGLCSPLMTTNVWGRSKTPKEYYYTWSVHSGGSGKSVPDGYAGLFSAYPTSMSNTFANSILHHHLQLRITKPGNSV